jgi:hypothetical protein
METEEGIDNLINAQSGTNLAFFLPDTPEYTIDGGSLYQSGVKISDTLYATLTTVALGNGYQVWEAREGSTTYGIIIFHLPKYTADITDFAPLEGTNGGNYLIAPTFSHGSSHLLSTI